MHAGVSIDESVIREPQTDMMVAGFFQVLLINIPVCNPRYTQDRWRDYRYIIKGCAQLAKNPCMAVISITREVDRNLREMCFTGSHRTGGGIATHC